MANSTLTKREKEILTKIIDGKSNSEIGDQLNISPRTVETHRYNIMRKVGASSLADLVKYAIRMGWLERYYYKG